MNNQNYMNHRGFIAIPLILALLVIVGGAGWWYVNKSSSLSVPTTNEFPTAAQNTNGWTQPVIDTQPVPSQNASASKITITAPTTGNILSPDQQTTVRWTIPTATINSFPQDFDVYVFLYVRKQGDAEGVNVAPIGDGHKAALGLATWNIPGYFSSGQLKSDTYKIVAQLQATPKDKSRLCARSVNKDCLPSEADLALMQLSVQIKGESGWFTIGN